jgi:hypothetical protein
VIPYQRSIGHWLTLTFSKGLKPTGNPDEFMLRVYVGNHHDPNKVDQAAANKIGEFMAANGYSKYQIAKRRFNWFPSAYDYTVLLAR